LVDKDNFLLFTSVLPEIVSGMIETRHIVTPVRSFCKKAKFFEANVDFIDFNNREIKLKHSIGKQQSQEPQTPKQEQEQQPGKLHEHISKYDYLVIALGSENNFFGNSDIEENAFALKTINDGIVLRNHLIEILEQANLEQDSHDLRKRLLTFVVVEGGSVALKQLELSTILCARQSHNIIKIFIRQMLELFLSVQLIKFSNNRRRIRQICVEKTKGKWCRIYNEF
jgi:NADH:ubiquinone reductase (H+-translocating)